METRLLIAGEQVEGDGERIAVENPATEETVAEIGTASRGQVDAAITAAREAFAGWATTPAAERAELLHEVATRLRARTDELAHAMTLEGGKPLIENFDEVGWTAAAFDYYAEMGRNFAGRVIPPIESSCAPSLARNGGEGLSRWSTGGAPPGRSARCACARKRKIVATRGSNVLMRRAGQTLDRL